MKHRRKPCRAEPTVTGSCRRHVLLGTIELTVFIGVMVIVMSTAKGFSTLSSFPPTTPCRRRGVRDSCCCCTGRSTMSASSSPRRLLMWLSSSPNTQDSTIEDGDDDDDDDMIVEEEDWRDFRAKLVLQSRAETGAAEKPNGRNDNKRNEVSSPGTWIYEAGDAIEVGSIVVSRAVQDFNYGGLRQHYFHKSVILIIQHSGDNNRTHDITRGVILNRPTDFCLLSNGEYRSKTDCSPAPIKESACWPVSFGGEVQGIKELFDEQQIICLHNIDTGGGDGAGSRKINARRNKAIQDVSFLLLKGVYGTIWHDAKMLVEAGYATPDQFVTFCGNAGWSPGQLQNELDRKDWSMVAMDSRSVFQQLLVQQKQEPIDAGLDMWNDLVSFIGKHNQEFNAVQNLAADDFPDRMIREWAKVHLSRSSNFLNHRRYLEGRDQSRQSRGCANIRPGLLLRTVTLNGGYWPNYPVFVNSVILILHQSKTLVAGVLLNRPTSSTVSVSSEHGHDSAELPLRYGGRFARTSRGSQPTHWFHYNHEPLMNAEVGSPLGDTETYDRRPCIWTCTETDAQTAIEMGLASPNDFVVVQGVSVWTKSHVGGGSLLEYALTHGDLEIVDDPNDIAKTWDALKRQTVVTSETLELDLQFANSAWECAGNSNSCQRHERDLAEEALGRWIKTFLIK